MKSKAPTAAPRHATPHYHHFLPACCPTTLTLALIPTLTLTRWYGFSVVRASADGLIAYFLLPEIRAGLLLFVAMCCDVLLIVAICYLPSTIRYVVCGLLLFAPFPALPKSIACWTESYPPTQLVSTSNYPPTTYRLSSVSSEIATVQAAHTASMLGFMFTSLRR